MDEAIGDEALPVVEDPTIEVIPEPQPTPELPPVPDVMKDRNGRVMVELRSVQEPEPASELRAMPKPWEPRQDRSAEKDGKKFSCKHKFVKHTFFL